jgi:hypothetical protein
VRNHWWHDKPNGLCDWAISGPGQEEHLATLKGEERFSEPREGGRKTSEGKELKWRVTFPTEKPRGRLPFVCDDLTPREWRVPAAPEKHDNGALAIKSITVLSKPTRMSQLYNPLVTVLGRARCARRLLSARSVPSWLSEEPMGTSSDKGPSA